jgi:hypothetical protein
VPLAELFQGDQIQNSNLQMVKDIVGHVHGKQPFALKYVVQVGLAETGDAGETALGSLAALDAVPEVFEKALLKV